MHGLPAVLFIGIMLHLGLVLGIWSPLLTLVDSMELAWAPNCYLATGLDLQRGCHTSAIDPASILETCDGARNDQACHVTARTPKGTYFTSTVSDASTFDSKVSTVSDVSGSGWGVSVSVGVSYMKSSGMSENSVSFTIGKTQDVSTKAIRTPEYMKLNSAAKQLLQSNPIGEGGFIEQYGLHYVEAIVYGGSFFGSVTLSEKSTSDGSSLGVFAKVSASDVFYSAAVSESVSTDMKSTSSHVRKYANAKFQGGQVTFNASSLLSMGKSFDDWQATVASQPNSIRFSFGNWYDLIEVQKVVNNMSVQIRQAFTAPPISTLTGQLLTQESAKSSYVMASISHAQEWWCFKNDETLKGEISTLGQQITTHIQQILNLKESSVVEIQTQTLNGDYSWFIAEGIQTKFNSLVAANSDKCGEYCMKSVYPNSLHDQQACTDALEEDSVRSEYNCPESGSSVMTGLTMSHGLDKNQASDSQTQVRCGSLPAQAPKMFTSSRSTTNWVSHGACDGDIAAIECPAGYAANGIHHTHLCNKNSLPGKYSRLVCKQVNNAEGYELNSDDCHVLNWHDQSAAFPDLNKWECPAGSLVTKIEFTHKYGKDLISDEDTRITCCPVKADFLACPLEALAAPPKFMTQAFVV